MRKIFMLAIANIRGSKSQAVSLLIFMLIAALCLNAGLVLYFDFGSYFDKRAEELHAPHAVIVQEERITKPEHFDWVQSNSMEAERYSVIAGDASYASGGFESSCVAIVSNADGEQSMNPPTLIGESLPLSEGCIYVPYLMKSTARCTLGGSFRITLSGREMDFSIAGFTEEMTFSSSTDLIYRFYVNDAEYQSLESEHPDLRFAFFGSRFAQASLGTSFIEDYNREVRFSDSSTDVASATYWMRDYDMVKSTRVLFPTIIAMIMTAFAIILIAVCLINMRFSIVNNIEKSMTNIGALKAVGYRNRQIVASILAQFGGIALLGSALGILLSRLLTPALSAVMESFSAIVWQPDFNAGLAAGALCFAGFMVLLVSVLAARRIFRLHPLIALRGGLLTHSFKKNNMPLDRSHGSLPFLLAMKRLLKAKGQSVMIMLIIAAVTFASVTGIAIYYQVGVNAEQFIAGILGEVPDAQLAVADDNETEALIERLLRYNGVRKAFGFESVAFTAEDKNTSVYVVRDCSLLEGSMLIDGQYPKHHNEMAASGVFMRMTGKRIGDKVSVGKGDAAKDFFICGEIQAVMNNSGGNVILMTYDAFSSVQPDYSFSQVNVYLEPGAVTADVLDSIEASEGALLSAAEDVQDMIDENFGSFSEIFALVAAVILAITVVVVALMLYLVIKTLILRRKREFGIQKAVGFTTLQIMHQIALGYMPVILIGVVLGGIGAVTGLSSLVSVLLGSMGIARMSISAPLDWTAIACAALWAFSYAMSMLVARRIRKISAHALVSE